MRADGVVKQNVRTPTVWIFANFCILGTHGRVSEWGQVLHNRESRASSATAGYNGGSVRTKIHRKARSEWLALMPNTHEGYISWEKAEAIRKMVRAIFQPAVIMALPSMATPCWRA